MKLVANALEDRRATRVKLSRATGVPYFDDLKKRKIYARCIPHCLTAEHKQNSLDIPTLLKEKFDDEDQAFMRRIVVSDEKWIRDFEPELKSKSKEWRATGSPRGKKDELIQRSSK